MLTHRCHYRLTSQSQLRKEAFSSINPPKETAFYRGQCANKATLAQWMHDTIRTMRSSSSLQTRTYSSPKLTKLLWHSRRSISVIGKLCKTSPIRATLIPHQRVHIRWVATVLFPSKQVLLQVTTKVQLSLKSIAIRVWNLQIAYKCSICSL